MSKVIKPHFRADIPHVPMNYADRDSIVGRLMEIVEAVIPVGVQQEATKKLIKKSVTAHFDESFGVAFSVLQHEPQDRPDTGSNYNEYCWAIWQVYLAGMPASTSESQPDN